MPHSSSKGCTPIDRPISRASTYVIRGVVEADGGAVVPRRRRDPRAANLHHSIHFDFYPFEPRGPLGRIVGEKQS